MTKTETATIDAFVDNIRRLRELREQQMKTLGELEYAALTHFIWKQRNGDLRKDERLRVTLEGTPVKGHVVITRNDGSYQKYPVSLRYMTHLSGDPYKDLADMWDNGLLHPRFIEILLERWGGRNDHPLRRKRLKKEAETGRRTPGPSLGYAEVYTPRGTVVSGGVLGDEGLPDMVDPSSTESAGSQEGPEV